MKTIERSIGDVAFVSGQKSYLDIPKDYWLRQLSLYLSGNLVIGTANATALKLESPLSLIKNIDLILNGKDVIKSLPFSAIHQWAKIRHKTAPANTAPGLTQATHAFAAGGVLDLGLPDGTSKVDTMLKAKGASTLQLGIDWETTAAGLVAPDTTTTLSITSGNLHVSTNEAYNVDDKIVFPVNREYALSLSPSATGIYQLKLPTGNLFWALLIRTVDNGALSNAVLNKLTLKSGTEVFRYFSSQAALRDNCKVDRAIETMPTGYYLVALTKDGMMSEALDARLMSDLTLEMDITFGTATKIDVYAQEIVVPRSAK